MPLHKSQKFQWGHNRRFNAYSEHIRQLFGGRIQKLSVDAGFSCPNRDGTIAYGGCTFCNNEAFNPSYCSPEKSITQQLHEGIVFHKTRYRRSSKYLAYFQAYTNTHAELQRLIMLYDEALSTPDVIGLVIGTRPDCVDSEKLDYFKNLSKKHYIIIEYGIESCNDHTLNLINRGHTFKQSVWALEETRRRGIKNGAHFIIGLPGESRKEILNQAKTISQLPIDNIKFHQLQILKNTEMEKQYSQNPDLFELFELDEYIDFIIEYIELLPPDMVIERITAETPPRYRIAPDWGNLRTDQILQIIENKLEEKDSWQGKRYNQ
ncbi:MAG TPA: TIGR01212 family radical SAM protein [Bacteroidales bacterium]|nr:TIGR01212 family radical SAM protein [Bacteroidales bacterium]